MYYALAPCLPVNKSVLGFLDLKNEPKDRLVYRGDIALVKVGGPSAGGKSIYALYFSLKRLLNPEKDVCDRCYDNASISILPWVKAWFQKLWELRYLESEFAKMRQLGVSFLSEKNTMKLKQFCGHCSR